MNRDGKFAGIRKGLLKFLVLKIISSKNVYAVEILEELGDTVFVTQKGTIYPLVNKMCRENLLDYQWCASNAGPPRKYYELTTKGRAQLREFLDYWIQLNRTIDGTGLGASG